MPKTRPLLHNKKRPTAVADAYAAFVADRQAANVTARTLDYYRDKLLPFIRWCEGNGAPHVGDITTQHPRGYILSLKERDLSAWTLHGAARAVRAFLRFCHSEGMIDAVPKITFPKLPKELLDPLTPDAVTRLLAVCENARDRAAVLFLLDTGLRAAEFCALNGGDIDIEAGAVLVQHGKGQKARRVFFGAKTKRALLTHWRESGNPGKTMPVWANLRTGARLTQSGLSQLLRRLGDRAGVEDCQPHAFRRSFALLSLRAGMDVHTLALLMGHEGIDVLKRYLKLTSTDAQAAHKRFGAVDSFLR